MLTTVGELAGFLVPAFVGPSTASWSARAALPAVVAAGFVEGLVLGAAQGTALHLVLPHLNRRRFAANTALAASFAYALGLVPSSWAGARDLPMAAAVVLGGLGGLALISSIGFAQWLEIRRHRAHSAWWIATTASAWLAGLAVFLGIAMPLWHEGQSLATGVAVGVVAAAGMAVTVALLTAYAALRLARTRAGT